MIKCMNRECNNYKCELDDNLEICPACHEPTTKIENSYTKRRNLTPIIGIASIAGIIISMMYFIYPLSFILGIGTIVGCIVFSIVIRMRAAIITSLISAAVMFGFLWYFGMFDMLFQNQLFFRAKNKNQGIFS